MHDRIASKVDAVTMVEPRFETDDDAYVNRHRAANPGIHGLLREAYDPEAGDAGHGCAGGGDPAGRLAWIGSGVTCDKSGQMFGKESETPGI